MSPQFDPSAFRSMFPEAPGWGVYLAGAIYAVKEEARRAAEAAVEAAKAAKKRSSWTPKDFTLVGGVVVAVIAALKGTGLA